mmetsp:Transcript_30721/g.93898  ORF Transcript_30721/g.93898 Transcript_30721/m.93898 type:complete len:423 (-) Transcript_30721:59-1327(-)
MAQPQRRRACSWTLALVVCAAAYCLLLQRYAARLAAPGAVPARVVPAARQAAPFEPALSSLYDELRREKPEEEEPEAPETTTRETPPPRPPLVPRDEERLRRAPFAGKTVLMFTMDSTAQYEANARRGGAAGEITVRKSLERALRELGATVEVARSDADFSRRCSVARCDADALVLDAWTWAAPGWRAKPCLVGRESRVLLLDFFGAEGPRDGGLRIPPERILTAFPTFPGNTFLGYALDDDTPVAVQTKRRRVVVWGKDAKHFDGAEAVLRAVAAMPGVEVHATLTTAPPSLRGVPIRYRGHLSKADWRALLAESKVVLGLGHPLLGPTALDAVAHGCVYVDPSYAKDPVKGYWSQHPYLRDSVGPPYVCAAQRGDPASYVACVDAALREVDLPPFVPRDFSRDAHRDRVRAIFEPVLLLK